MRIIFITTQINLKTGGGSNLTPHLKASSMVELGHQVKILTLFPEKNAFLEKPSYEVIESPTRFKNWILLQFKIFFVLKKLERFCDAFSFEGEHFMWGAGLYRMLGGKTPVMMHFNGPIFSIYENGTIFRASKTVKKSLKSRLMTSFRIIFERYIGLHWARHIDMYTADSPLMKEWHEKYGLRKEKIIVLPEFVDLLPYFEKSTSVRKNDPDKTNLIYVGRLAPEKGVDTLLSAVKEMKNRQNLLVRIVGDGRQKEELMNLSEKYGLEKTVEFHAWADKKTLVDLYNESDIFVHPARWAEPFGVTIVEAMASGLPVITPEISGSSWAAGEGGIVFENGNSEDLREKIEMLMSNQTFRKNLAEKAKIRARNFDYRNFKLTFEKILKNLTKA